MVPIELFRKRGPTFTGVLTAKLLLSGINYGVHVHMVELSCSPAPAHASAFQAYMVICIVESYVVIVLPLPYAANPLEVRGMCGRKVPKGTGPVPWQAVYLKVEVP